MNALKRFFAAAAFYCLALGSLPAGAEVVDRIVAVVGDDVITLSELDRAYKDDALGIRAPDPFTGEATESVSRSEYLDKLIEKKLIEQEVKRKGIDVDALEVEKQIDGKRESMGLTRSQFEDALASRGVTMEEYRAQTKDQMIMVRLISEEVRGEIEVTDDEIESYYRQHPEFFISKEQVRLYHIFLAFPEGADEEERQATVKRLDDIRVKIKEGKDFQEMAMLHSNSPTAESGGELQYPVDQLLPPFDEQVGRLSLGEMSPVFLHEKGANLIMLAERKMGERVPLDQVRDRIAEVLYQEEAIERYDLWLERLKARTYIENRLKKD